MPQTILRPLRAFAQLTLAIIGFCMMPNVFAQSAADCQAYADRARNEQPVLGGAARGAAGGALFGAIAGNAGKGAAIGALVGGVGRAARRNQSANYTFDDCMSRRR